MKKLIEKYTLSIVTASCIIFLVLLVLMKLFRFDFNVGEVITYTMFFISLSLFSVLVFILVREKKYETIKKRMIRLTAIMAFLSIVFFILLRLDLVFIGGMGGGFGLVFIYVLYPFVLFMLICTLSILLYKKQFKMVKRLLLEFCFWIIFFVGCIYLCSTFLQ